MTYSANSLNQYTQRTVPGAVDILGVAHSNATVTVNNQATSRHEGYFHKQLAVPNSAAAAYTNASIVGVRKNAGTNQQDVVTQITGKVFVAQSPELFGYDADGNLTNDGRFAYTWDAENRLVNVETAVSAVQAGAPKQKLLFGYDHQSRRVSKVVSNYVSGSWLLTSDSRFIYDVWNLIAETIRTSQSAITNSYVWGLDLSGTEQGAGGIDGLLSVTVGNSGTYFAAFDGNGNLAALINAVSGVASAQYEYSPFGELIRATGPLAKANPFRFSTKYQDDETSLLYYGYRFYSTSTGRWPSRDPIDERGGLNLYGFVDNDSMNYFDVLALKKNGATPPWGTTPPPPLPGKPSGPGYGNAADLALDLAKRLATQEYGRHLAAGEQQCMRAARPSGCFCCQICMCIKVLPDPIIVVFGGETIGSLVRRTCSELKKDMASSRERISAPCPGGFTRICVLEKW